MRILWPRATLLSLITAFAVAMTLASLIFLRSGPQVVTPLATKGKFTMAVSPDRVRSGELVVVKLTIAGPAQFVSSCQVPNPEIWVVSPEGRRIPLTQPLACQSGGRFDIGEGEALTEPFYWNTSSGLAPGLYSIHGKLSGFPVPLFSDENLPVVRVQIG
jgi:hypothetical protein